MQRSRSLVWLAAGGALLVWLASDPFLPSETPVRAAREAVRPAGAPVAAAMNVLPDIASATLRDRVVPDLAGRQRNPFRYRGRSDTRPGARAAAEQEAQARPLAAVPEMQLLGIASDDRDGTLVRTAAVSLMQQLYLVREGEQIALRFLVGPIGPDSVELRDLANETTIRLALK